MAGVRWLQWQQDGLDQSCRVRAMPWMELHCGEKQACRQQQPGPGGPGPRRGRKRKSGSQQWAPVRPVLRCGHYVGASQRLLWRACVAQAADRSACQAVRRYGQCEQCEVLLERKASKGRGRGRGSPVTSGHSAHCTHVLDRSKLDPEHEQAKALFSSEK